MMTGLREDSKGQARSRGADAVEVERLKRLVALGEGQALEFKLRVPADERVAREVVAFANTGGGKLLIGVSDSGKLVGVKDAPEELFALDRALSSSCEPAIAYTTKRVSISRKREVIVVGVERSDHRPHFVINESDGTATKAAFIRYGDQSIEASREALRLLRTREDDSVKFEFGDKELMLMRYLDTYGQITVTQFATLADIRRRDASHTLVLLTRAGVLQFHATDRDDFFTASEARRTG